MATLVTDAQPTVELLFGDVLTFKLANFVAIIGWLAMVCLTHSPGEHAFVPEIGDPDGPLLQFVLPYSPLSRKVTFYSALVNAVLYTYCLVHVRNAVINHLRPPEDPPLTCALLFLNKGLGTKFRRAPRAFGPLLLV
jgi:hypothetical protein